MNYEQNIGLDFPMQTMTSSECFDPFSSYDPRIDEFKEIRIKYLEIQFINDMVSVNHEGDRIIFRKFIYIRNQNYDSRQIKHAIIEYAKLKEVPIDNTTIEFVNIK